MKFLSNKSELQQNLIDLDQFIESTKEQNRKAYDKWTKLSKSIFSFKSSRLAAQYEYTNTNNVLKYLMDYRTHLAERIEMINKVYQHDNN